MKKIIKVILIVLFFVLLSWVINLPFAKAEELNCETFVKEEICNMTDEEAEKWFWELFKSLMEPKETKVKTVEV
jgi:hypothetical protein